MVCNQNIFIYILIYIYVIGVANRQVIPSIYLFTTFQPYVVLIITPCILKIAAICHRADKIMDKDCKILVAKYTIIT